MVIGGAVLLGYGIITKPPPGSRQYESDESPPKRKRVPEPWEYIP